MLRSSWLILFLSMGMCLPSAWGSRLRHKQVHRLKRDVIKEVKVHIHKKELWFHWRSPGGALIRYKARDVRAGFRARLNKLTKAGTKRLAVGGRYALQNAKTGTVRPGFVYAIKAKWRGVRAVKLDGLMPLFTASILPTAKGKAATAYTIYGTITSRLNDRDNRLICLYGTWFQLDAPKRPNRISQSRGVKGPSLFFFPAKYRTPRSWRMLADPAAKRRAYFAALKRKKKGLPPLKRPKLIPVLSAAQQQKYLAQCLKRLNKWEAKFHTSPARPTPPRSAPPTPRTK